MSDRSAYQVLRDFGFSRTAILCYETLFERGGASVPQLARRTGKPRTGLYRVLRQLEDKGFVSAVKTGTQPTYFYAEPVEAALSKYTDYQWRIAESLMDEQAAALAQRSGPSGRPGKRGRGRSR
jgi:sugar-specific transcriptional regulator TrmB